MRPLTQALLTQTCREPNVAAAAPALHRPLSFQKPEMINYHVVGKLGLRCDFARAKRFLIEQRQDFGSGGESTLNVSDAF